MSCWIDRSHKYAENKKNLFILFLFGEWIRIAISTYFGNKIRPTVYKLLEMDALFYRSSVLDHPSSKVAIQLIDDSTEDAEIDQLRSLQNEFWFEQPFSWSVWITLKRCLIVYLSMLQNESVCNWEMSNEMPKKTWWTCP